MMNSDTKWERLFFSLSPRYPLYLSKVKQCRIGMDIEPNFTRKSTEPMHFDCERIVYCGVGWLISKEK